MPLGVLSPDHETQDHRGRGDCPGHCLRSVLAMRKSIVAAALLLAANALGQRKLVETIEVHVVNVDVVVTDREGNRVRGLTKDDFELYEDKRPQTITNFYEARDDVRPPAAQAPGSAAAPAPPEQRQHRRFAFFVDNDSLHPTVRKEVIASLHKFVDANFRPGDEASVISFNRAPKIVPPLMSDKASILRAIDNTTASPVSTKTDRARVQQGCTNDPQMARSGRLMMKVAYDDCIGTVH